MLTLLNQVKFLVKDEKGQTVIEYALMLVLVGLAVAAASPNLSSAVVSTFGRVNGALAS